MANEYSASSNLRSQAKKNKNNSDEIQEVLAHCFGPSRDPSQPLGFDNLQQHIDATMKSHQQQANESSPSNQSINSSSSSSSSSSSCSVGQKSSSPFVPNLKSGVKSFFGEKKSKNPTNVSPEGAIINGKIGLSEDVGLQQHSLDVVPGNSLAIIGNNNFQSVKASHCVFKGKWMYEVLLGTSGLMQVGWCLASCKFNREEGVGDTKDSYAFDGYREAKWNGRSSTKYGMAWEADDIVTCLLDLEERTASFMLNGKNMGVAFTNICVGPAFAYFPGLSLAFKEIAYCNFGHRPFTYPVEGYLPLQPPPSSVTEARMITTSLQRLYLLPDSRPDVSSKISFCHRNMILSHIMQRLCPLMKTVYNVDAYLLPLLLSVTPSTCKQNEITWLPEDTLVYKGLHGILSALWEYSDVKDARDIVNHIFASVMRNYRSSPTDVQLKTQVELLIFVQGLLLHKQTRRNIAIACSFDKHSELPSLFHIKHISKHSENGLDSIMLDTALDDFSPNVANPIAWNEERKAELERRIQVVKSLQKSIMRLLVVENTGDGNMVVSCTFVKYFRNYLKNICASSRTNDMTVVCPALVLHSFMQCLLNVVQYLWDYFADNHSIQYRPSHEAYIPIELFYTDTIDYFELQRAGGLKNFLFNEHKDVLAKEGVTVLRGRGRRSTNDDTSSWNDPFHRFSDDSSSSGPSILSHTEEESDYDAFTPVIRLARALLNSQSSKGTSRGVMVTRQRSKQAKEESVPTKPAVLELADGCLLLYTTVIHQQMDKIHTIRVKVGDYRAALRNIEGKLAKCGPTESAEVRTSLEHSKNVLLHHLSELQRSYTWLSSSVYSAEAQQNLWWMLQLALKTIHKSSERGVFFKFIPEFYLSSTSKLYKCLREYMSSSLGFDNLPDFQATLTQFVKFLSKFHCDSRIVNNDVKTSLANTIATFVTYPEQLKIVESLPEEDLNSFVRNMMYAYDEDKPWTSVGHRILATLWRGSGFAMRYDHPPYVRKVRQLLIRDRDPFVPSVLLNCIKNMLLNENELSGKFIHSILEHLNWSFSEFIGQLQEVQAQNARGWDNNSGLLASLDAQALRQLRIVDMLFELSVALMRVLELTVALAPHVYLDWEGRETSETLMNSLVQCINQILSRVTSKDNLFEKVVAEKQPGLSTVQHYPLMTGSSGILLSLLNQERDDCLPLEERLLKVFYHHKQLK